MSITDRQKKIINPYAETLDTPERRGIGYDYNNRRNRFIQDAIQERYIYFFQFPKINEPLRVKAEDNIENPQIHKMAKLLVAKQLRLETMNQYYSFKHLQRNLQTMKFSVNILLKHLRSLI